VLAYVLTNRSTCEIPFGVSIILLGNNSLNGTLSGGLLGDSALRISIEILILNGKYSLQFLVLKIWTPVVELHLNV
jgi:hypothetical protein